VRRNASLSPFAETTRSVSTIAERDASLKLYWDLIARLALSGCYAGVWIRDA